MYDQVFKCFLVNLVFNKWLDVIKTGWIIPATDSRLVQHVYRGTSTLRLHTTVLQCRLWLQAMKMAVPISGLIFSFIFVQWEQVEKCCPSLFIFSYLYFHLYWPMQKNLWTLYEGHSARSLLLSGNCPTRGLLLIFEDMTEHVLSSHLQPV